MYRWMEGRKMDDKGKMNLDDLPPAAAVLVVQESESIARRKDAPGRGFVGGGSD